MGNKSSMKSLIYINGHKIGKICRAYFITQQRSILTVVRNSAVEASHRVIEDELYANLWKYTKCEFLAATSAYQAIFNLARYNSYKKGTPLALLKELM